LRFSDSGNATSSFVTPLNNSRLRLATGGQARELFNRPASGFLRSRQILIPLVIVVGRYDMS